MQRFLSSIMRFMPAIFWLLVAIVSVLMLIELKPSTSSIPYVDKLEHAFVFIALTITGSLAYAQHKQRVYIGLIALGALYEVLQGLLTITRQASIYDWVADVAGILLGIMISAVIANYTSRLFKFKV
jgi:VanZ family protein